MELTDRAIDDDQDLKQILSWLKNAPPGRVYAKTKGNWGEWMKLGAIHLYDLLPTEQFATVMPWQMLSLNAPLLWQLDIPSPEICQLFNIRYVIAPPVLKLPAAYREILNTSRYKLYETDSGGYMQFGQIARVKQLGSSQELFRTNREWLESDEPAKGQFTAFRTTDGISERDLVAPQSNRSSGASPAASITDEVVTPDLLSARVTTDSQSVLILKVTYHPNWHVTVDGVDQPAFMVSPSFIGVRMEQGHHEIRAEYRSSR